MPLIQTSSFRRQNPDKARLFCILAIGLALSSNDKDDDSEVLSSVFNSLTRLYPSRNDLARDLLNSDDRFLATASALIALRKKLCDSSTSFSLCVVLAAFRDIQFDAKVLLDWIDGDELGYETVSAIVTSLTEDRNIWEKAADLNGSVSSPVAKRRRLSLDSSAEYRTVYLQEKQIPSEDDVIVKVRVPHVEGTGNHNEETFTFSRKPLISNSYRLMLPKPDASDFSAVEEMMVELKLMLNKRLLESVGLDESTEKLRDALAEFLGDEGDGDDDEEVEEDEE